MKINDRSLSLWAVSSSPVDKEGYLVKKGEINKQFHRRWFLLKGNLLFYFERRADKEPVGVIVLEEHSVAMSENKDMKYAFDITFSAPASRVYTLAADTEELAMAWMRAIAHASFEYLRLMVQELQKKVDALTEQRRDTSALGSKDVRLSTGSVTSRDSRRGLAGAAANVSSRRHDVLQLTRSASSAVSSSQRPALTLTQPMPPLGGGDLQTHRGNTSVVTSSALAVGHTTSSSLLDEEPSESGGSTANVPSPQQSHHDPPPRAVPFAKRNASSERSARSPAGDRRAPMGRSASADPEWTAGTPKTKSRLASSGTLDSDFLSVPEDTHMAAAAPAEPFDDEDSGGTVAVVNNLVDLGDLSPEASASASGGTADECTGLTDEQLLKQISFHSMHQQSFLGGSPQITRSSGGGVGGSPQITRNSGGGCVSGSTSSDHDEDLF